MSQAPAGWYPQPDGTQRYWDGTAWTEHISGTPQAAPSETPAPAVAEPAAKAKAASKPKAVAAAAPSETAASEPVVIASSDGPMPLGGVAQPMQAAVPVASPSDLDAAAPRKRKVWPIVVGVIGAIVLVIVIAIIALVLVLRSVTSGPQESAQALFDAWKSQDCEAEYAVTESSNLGTVDEFCANADYSWVDDMEGWTIDITGTSITNDSAVVTTTETYTWQGEGDPVTETWEYNFANIDGEWLYTGSSQV